MSYWIGQLKYFYDGIIPFGYKGGRLPIYLLLIVLSSVLLVSVVGVNSLLLLPGILIFYAVFRYPMFPIYLLLGSLPFTMYFFTGINKFYSYSVVLMIFALWAITKLLRKEFSFDYSKFLVSLISIFYFVIIVTALKDGLSYPEINGIIRYTIFFPLIMVIYDTYKPEHTMPILIAITIPFIVSSYFVFIKFSHVRGIFEFLQLYRLKPGGIFSNANAYGAAAIFAAPFWIALAIWIKSGYRRLFYAAVAAVLTFSILLSNSRSAIFGLLLAIIFFFSIGKKLRYLLAITVALIIIFVSSPILRGVSSAGLRLDRGSSNRSEIWANSYDLIKKNIMFGVGTGNFGRAYNPYINTTFDKGFIKGVAHAHNETLETMAEFGIAGLIIIMALFYVPFKRGFQLLKKTTGNHKRAVVYGLIGILFANLGNSFFDANTMLSAGGLYPPILFWVVIIMILKLHAEFWRRGDIQNNLKNK